MSAFAAERRPLKRGMARVGVACAGLAVIYFAATMLIGAWPAICTAGIALFCHGAFVPKQRLPAAWILILVAIQSQSATDTPISFTTDIADFLANSYSYRQIVRFVFLFGVYVLIVMEAGPRIVNIVLGGLRYGFARAYGAYLAVILLSTLWSENPVVTFAKGSELLAAFLLTLVCLRKKDSAGSLFAIYDALIAYFLVVATIALLGLELAPDLYLTHSRAVAVPILSGGPISLSANALSRIGSMLVLVAATRLFGRFDRDAQWARSGADKATLLCVIAMGLFIEIAAYGRTGMLSTMCVAVTLCLLKASKNVLLAIGAVLLAPALLLAGSAIFPSFFEFFRRGQDMQEFYALSGRMDYWRAALDLFYQSPLLGYGFGVGGRITFLQMGINDVSSLHSGVMEMLVGIGAVGFAAWLVPVAMWFCRSIAGLRIRAQVETSLFVIPLTWGTVLSTGLGGWMDSEGGLLVLLLALQHVLRRRRVAAMLPVLTALPAPQNP